MPSRFVGIVVAKAMRNQALSVMYVRCEIYRIWCFNKDSEKRQRRVAYATPCIKMVTTRERVFQEEEPESLLLKW